jgi:hypothetical protein
VGLPLELAHIGVENRKEFSFGLYIDLCNNRHLLLFEWNDEKAKANERDHGVSLKKR